MSQKRGHRRESDVMMEAEIGIICFEDGGSDYKPRNISGNKNLEKVKKPIPP